MWSHFLFSSIGAEPWVSDSYSSPWSSSYSWRTFTCSDARTCKHHRGCRESSQYSIYLGQQSRRKRDHDLKVVPWPGANTIELKWTELCSAAGSYQHLEIRVPFKVSVGCFDLSSPQAKYTLTKTTSDSPLRDTTTTVFFCTASLPCQFQGKY